MISPERQAGLLAGALVYLRAGVLVVLAYTTDASKAHAAGLTWAAVTGWAVWVGVTAVLVWTSGQRTAVPRRLRYDRRLRAGKRGRIRELVVIALNTELLPTRLPPTLIGAPILMVLTAAAICGPTAAVQLPGGLQVRRFDLVAIVLVAATIVPLVGLGLRGGWLVAMTVVAGLYGAMASLEVFPYVENALTTNAFWLLALGSVSLLTVTAPGRRLRAGVQRWAGQSPDGRLRSWVRQ